MENRGLKHNFNRHCRKEARKDDFQGMGSSNCDCVPDPNRTVGMAQLQAEELAAGSDASFPNVEHSRV
jgi:hypothetical protein